MKSRNLRSLIFSVAIALAVATFVVTLAQKGNLERLQMEGVDLFFHLRGNLPFNQNIIIVEIDDTNILKIGQWPWERTWFAAMTRALKTLGAQAIYYDILFAEPTSGDSDQFFAQEMKNAGSVYLPFAFPGQLYDFDKAVKPVDLFARSAKSVGSINIYPDKDGVVRKIPLLFRADDRLYSHIALDISAGYLGYYIKDILPNRLILSDAANKITEIPLIGGDSMVINWLGKWQRTFKHYSFLDVINAYTAIAEGKTPSIDVEPFKKSICLVAPTAIGLVDINSTPLEPQYPGIGVIANSIDNIISGQFLYTTPVWFHWFLVFVFALIPALIITGEKALRESMTTIFIGLGFAVLSYFLFLRSLWIETTLPLLSLFGSYLLIATYDFARVSVEKKNFFKMAITDELTTLYNIRYFRVVLQTECIMARADSHKKFCMVMCDIDHFKKFNDTYGHQVGDFVLKETAAVLKHSVRSSDVVARYGGEEMIILLRGVGLASGMELADKIRQNLQNHKFKDEKNIYSVTISVGVSKFVSNDTDETIIKRADAALYKAKELGRNRTETLEFE